MDMSSDANSLYAPPPLHPKSLSQQTNLLSASMDGAIDNDQLPSLPLIQQTSHTALDRSSTRGHGSPLERASSLDRNSTMKRDKNLASSSTLGRYSTRDRDSSLSRGSIRGGSNSLDHATALDPGTSSIWEWRNGDFVPVAIASEPFTPRKPLRQLSPSPPPTLSHESLIINEGLRHMNEQRETQHRIDDRHILMVDLEWREHRHAEELAKMKEAKPFRFLVP